MLQYLLQQCSWQWRTALLNINISRQYIQKTKENFGKFVEKIFDKDEEISCIVKGNIVY